MRRTVIQPQQFSPPQNSQITHTTPFSQQNSRQIIPSISTPPQPHTQTQVSLSPFHNGI